MGSRKSRGRIPFLCLALAFLNLCQNWSPRTLVDLNSASWSFRKTSLKAYKSENGGVPRNYETSDGFKLGIWVRNKRVAKYAKSIGRLSSDRIKELDDLGFVWDVSDHQWQHGIQKLKAYKSENGGVPLNYETSDGFKLGIWVRDQRVAKSIGRLSSDRIKELDDLGFVWDVSDHQWQHGIQKLKDYKSENGGVVVPRNYETSDGFKLGIWVRKQRVAKYAKSIGRLSSDRIKELDDLGFV